MRYRVDRIAAGVVEETLDTDDYSEALVYANEWLAGGPELEVNLIDWEEERWRDEEYEHWSEMSLRYGDWYPGCGEPMP